MNREALKGLLEGTLDEFGFMKPQQQSAIKNRLVAAKKEIDDALRLLKGTSKDEINHKMLLTMAKQLDRTIKGIK